ncbi:FHA domain-containing protein [Cryobacterium sp. TMB1-7]|uniref:FHA domain-containing protein n=1 Tax=Cryobacterium sp. TMB1-7 TaxID=2555866 RepID=UPI00106BE074|nr:FHA domain-containing protein [Cryobacterium sp. TMB1-7]TFC57438.1 FHA domain-containing protein [Cryobacterium sp. TMB1-7]
MLSYDDDNRGGWLAAATGDRLVLLPAADSAAGARVWASLVGAGSSEQGARAVLDELTAGGLSKTPPFALLTWDDSVPATVRVFVRGEVEVVLTTADGDLSIGGLGISTWVERSVADVTALSVTAVPVVADADPIGTEDLAALPLGAGLPLRAGMVRTRRLRLAVDGASAASPTRAEPTRVEPARVQPIAQIVPPPAAPKTAPPPLPPARPIAEPASEQTISDIPAAEPANAPPAEPAPEPDADPAGGYDHLFGATVMRGVEQAAVRPEAEADDDEPVAPAVVAPSDTDPDDDDPDDDELDGDELDGDELDGDLPGDHDGHTVMSGDIQRMRASRRRIAAEPAAVAPRLYLLLPSGVREPLSQPIRVGRAPSVSKISGGLVPKLVSLGGADQDVSRNHVHFTVEGDTVVVTDLHSRNGTLVVLPGKPAQKLRQGEPTAVIVGTVIDLGSGITLTVGQE